MNESRVIPRGDNAKPALVPANPVQRDLILDIQKAVSSSPLCEQYHMNFISEPFKIYTIASMFLDGIRIRLGADSKQSISIGGLITIEKSERYRETNEKSGNINCKIILGDIGRRIWEEGIDGFDDILMSDEIMKEDMTFAQNYARKELTIYGYGFNSHGYEIYQIALLFLVYMLIITRQYAENPTIEENNFEIIIGTYFTVKFKREEGKMNIYFLPNKKYKTIVKSDLQTEDE